MSVLGLQESLVGVWWGSVFVFLARVMLQFYTEGKGGAKGVCPSLSLKGISKAAAASQCISLGPVTCGLVNIWMRPTEAVLSAFLVSLPPPISLTGFLRVLEREELGRIFN